MNRLRAELKAFHNEEAGLTTVEIVVILFAAALLIAFLQQGGKDTINLVINHVKALIGAAPTFQR
jgi:hypothetical protein